MADIDPSTGKIRTIQKRVDENSALIERIVDRLVQDYCSPLDELLVRIKEIVSDSDRPPTDKELDDFALNLPIVLYFTGEAMESLGIKEDIAKALKQEVYNEQYDRASGTIADKTAIAELASQQEQIAHIAYQRAYKKIKLRMETAGELLQSVKKVITRRGQEYELSRIDPSRIGGR